jgi:flagellar protein FliT
MTQTLIDYYRAIEDGSAKMLAAARDADWDTVVRFEGVCAVLIEQLKERARCEELTAQTRMEKTRIMLRILGNDANIRHLAEPWLETFDFSPMPSGSFLH